MTSYTIQINEYQRELLLKLLRTVNIETVLKDHPSPACFPPDTAVEEATWFIKNLEDLPTTEREMIEVRGCAPGMVVHGFCL